MADPARYLVRQPQGVPSIIVYPQTLPDDPVTRVIIRDSKNLSSDWLTVGTTEMELARGNLIAREMSSAGRLLIEVKGKLNVANGDSGNIALKLYASTNADPNVAKGSMTLIATHNVAVANPGASGGTDGSFRWTLEWAPNGTPDTANSQGFYSACRYQRFTTDVVNLSESMLRTSIDLRTSDLVLLPTVARPAGMAASILDIFSIDGYVSNGQSGQA